MLSGRVNLQLIEYGGLSHVEYGVVHFLSLFPSFFPSFFLRLIYNVIPTKIIKVIHK